jgi:proliferating cell nuclear antigen
MVQVSEFREWLQSVSEFLEEATIYNDEEGLRIRSLDPSHVILVDSRLKTDIKFEEPVIVNVLDCIRLLKGFEGEAEIRVEEKKLKIMSESFKLEIPLLDSEAKNPPTIPQLSFDVVAELPTAELVRAFENMEKIADYVRITAGNQTLVLNARSDVAALELTLKPERLVGKDGAKASYSLSYLMRVGKTLRRLADWTTLEYTTDKPAKFTSENESVEITILVAPRIE